MAKRTIEYVPRTVIGSSDGDVIDTGSVADDIGEPEPIAEPVAAAEFNGIPIVEPGSGEPGISADSGTEFDPEGTEPIKRRRGRQPGTKNKPKETQVQGSLKGIEKLLISIHMAGAVMLKTPELILDPSEAKDLTEAINGVAKFYPVGMSEKALAWMNLATTMAGIEGSRILAIKLRKQKEKTIRLHQAGPQRMPEAPARKPEVVQPPVNGAPKVPTSNQPGNLVEVATDYYMMPPTDVSGAN